MPVWSAPSVPRTVAAATAFIVVAVGAFGGSFYFRDANNNSIGRISGSGGHLVMSGSIASDILLNCDSVDTTSTGMLICGTDAGAAGGLSYAEGSAHFVDESGDTMTGALNVRATISGSSLRVDDLLNCDTIDTDGAGVLSCGTDDSSAGLSFADASSYFVDDGGDTMTGALRVNANVTYTGAGSGWSLTLSGGHVDALATPVIFALVASGTNVATGAIGGDFTMPFDGKILWAHVNVDNPHTDGISQFDVNINGTTIFSTNPTIDALEDDSDTAATAPVINGGANSFNQGDKITFDVDTAAGGVKLDQGLKVRAMILKERTPLTQP